LNNFGSDEEDNDFEFNQRDNYLRVVKIRPLFPLPLSTMPPTGIINPAILNQIARPVIEMKLEDGSLFRMGGIPTSIALEIWEVLERKKISGTEENIDPRFTLAQVINEIAEVRRVRIVDLLENYNVYVAEIDLIPEGFGKPITLKMIPSHAILVGVRANADIFVYRTLVETEQQIESERDESEEGFYEI